MLTLFTIPKPFTGEFAAIQRNAIRSWTLLHPHCDILLFGDEAGAAEVAGEMNARHVAAMDRNEYHTPIVSGVFTHAADLARTDLIAYVNTDIVLMSDFVDAVQRVAARFPRFLMIGDRRNLSVKGALEFDASWEERLRRRAATADPFYPGMDYFVFPRTLWGEIPPFALGRLYWDNWFVYAARLRKAVVVDATPVVLAIHQNHSFAPGQLGGPESQRNWQLLGGAPHLFTARQSTHVLTPNDVRVRCRSCYPACVCAEGWAGRERADETSELERGLPVLSAAECMETI